jgi:hypothetical protein
MLMLSVFDQTSPTIQRKSLTTWAVRTMFSLPFVPSNRSPSEDHTRKKTLLPGIGNITCFDLQLKQRLVCARFQMWKDVNLKEQRTSVSPQRAAKH